MSRFRFDEPVHRLRAALVIFAAAFWALAINDGLHAVSVLVALVCTGCAVRAFVA